MKKETYGVVESTANGLVVIEVGTGNVITNLFRPVMIVATHRDGEALKYNYESGRGKRVPLSEIPIDTHTPISASIKELDPILELIKNSASIKPSDLEMSDVKWKYLVRSAVRGKNIMMVGPAGCGKTQAAKALPVATGHPFFYFNLGATQDPRSTLIGNTHFKDGQTVFDSSSFVKAIQTDNILMTVLDEGQRYLRLDEDTNSPVINVAPGVSFIATANIGSEYTSTRVLDRALMDRFEIIEVDILTKEQEEILLTKRYGNVLSSKQINAVADIASVTRKEWRSESGKLTTMVSTRQTVRLCELLTDGFDLLEATEVAILPFFDAAGGVDSERTFVKQIIQKFAAETNMEDIFNIDDTKESETSPF